MDISKLDLTEEQEAEFRKVFFQFMAQCFIPPAMCCLRVCVCVHRLHASATHEKSMPK